MKASVFCSKLVDVATKYKTLYVMGCFGAPLNAINKQRYTNNHDYNRDPKRTARIMAATSDTFGFDCVNLIKAILWGWIGDVDRAHGGAMYKSNGVPDVSASVLFGMCSDVSDDFTNIVPGEMLYRPGHCGVYIGDGLAVECTPKWSGGVQKTVVANIGTKSCYNLRMWDRHGKLPFIDYTDAAPVVADWASASWTKATAKGLVDGTRPHDVMTRAEMTVILDRLGLL